MRRDRANNVLRDIKRQADRAGRESTVPITAHTFRKSHGKNNAENGPPMNVLQELMGQTSITATGNFYLRVGDAGEREATYRCGRPLVRPESEADFGNETNSKMTREGDGR